MSIERRIQVFLAPCGVVTACCNVEEGCARARDAREQRREIPHLHGRRAGGQLICCQYMSRCHVIHKTRGACGGTGEGAEVAHDGASQRVEREDARPAARDGGGGYEGGRGGDVVRVAHPPPPTVSDAVAMISAASPI